MCWTDSSNPAWVFLEVVYLQNNLRINLTITKPTYSKQNPHKRSIWHTTHAVSCINVSQLTQWSITIVSCYLRPFCCVKSTKEKREREREVCTKRWSIKEKSFRTSICGTSWNYIPESFKDYISDRKSK